MMKLQPISLSTIPDAIIQQIKSLIATGRLKPGDRLPNERDLVDQFGVGRSSVREAMMALAAMGLVVRTREGTYVNPDPARLVWSSLDQGGVLTRSTIHDVFETRRLFEVGIAALAAERATPEAIAAIRQWVPDRVGDVEAFKQADVQFHTAIARAAANPLVFELYSKVQELLFQTHQYYTALERLDPNSSAAMYEAILQQHRAILEAIERQNPAAAQQAVLVHFVALEESMLRNAEEAEAADAGADDEEEDLGADDEGDESLGSVSPG